MSISIKFRGACWVYGENNRYTDHALVLKTKGLNDAGLSVPLDTHDQVHTGPQVS